MSTNVKPGPVAPKSATPENATPVVTDDVVLTLLTEQANDAIVYAQSFGPMTQDVATLVNATTILTRMGHASEDDATGENDLANLLRSVIGSIDTAAATVALTVARAKYATVVNYVKGNPGMAMPTNLKSLTGSTATSDGNKRLKGYAYTITAGEQSVTYASLADLATALKGKPADYREAAHNTVGDERPATFTFEVDGITVTANKASE